MYDHMNQIEEEFKPIHEKNGDENELNEQFKSIYKNNLFLYLGYILLPFFLSVFIVIAFSNNDFFFKEVGPSAYAVESAVSDVNALLVVDPQVFNELDTSYSDFLIHVGTTGHHYIYVHSEATFVLNESFFDLEDGPKLKNDVIQKMMSGQIRKWPNNAVISFYIPIDDIPVEFAGTSLDDPSLLTKEGTVVTTAFNAIFSFAVMFIIAVPMMIISKPIIKQDYMQLKKQEESPLTIFSYAVTGMVMMLGASFISGIIVIAITTIFNLPNEISANQLAINLMLKSPYFILMVLSAVILGPIVEELVFRKSFFGLIKNDKIALIASSLVFGLIHITTEILSGNIALVIVGSIPYIAGGFVFGYIYMRHKKNIVIPILAHMLYNLLSILLLFMPMG